MVVLYTKRIAQPFFYFQFLNFFRVTLHAQITSVPLNIALRLASLFVLQVLQDACIGTDGNIIIFPTSERR